MSGVGDPSGAAGFVVDTALWPIVVVRILWDFLASLTLIRH